MHASATRKPDLTRALAARIRAAGPLTVAAYMEAAISAYYAEGGSVGADFTTAPEISQMFGEMLGAWLRDAQAQEGWPARLVELGPGRGTLMADILRVFAGTEAEVHFVETSPALRRLQAEKVPAARWHDRLEDVPEGPCLIVANEFFDALPVHQFEKTEEGWMERRVDWQDGGFVFTAAPAAVPPGFPDAPAGSVFEVCPAGLSVMEEIARRLSARGGAALIADYGHAQPGLGDTLQAVGRRNVLEAPGTQDLTAHVDFGTLAAVAAEGGLRVHGPVGQGEFLNALGIAARAERLAEKGGRAAVALALHRLTSPSEMGSLFKVMGLTPEGVAWDGAGF